MYTSGILPYDIGLVTYNWKINMHLSEAVDAGVLNDAVQRAATRYPYFKKRLVREGDSYKIVDNDQSLVVYDCTNGVRSLNHESVNHHLISVGYSGETIEFAISHMLAGACGLVEWVKTVLYLYLSAKYGVELQVDGVRLPGEEIPETERQFISKEVLEAADDDNVLDISAVSEFSNGEAPLLDYLRGFVLPQFNKRVYYRFEFPQKEFMEKARGLEASPAVLLSALMFKALCKLWPDRNNDIQGMMAHNYRAEVGLPETICDLIRYIHIRYPAELVDAPLDKMCTVARGQVILQSEKAFALRDAKTVLDRIEAVDGIPNLDAKKIFCMLNPMYGTQVLDSYQVSYVGRTQWGDMLPYITAGDIVTEGHLMVEVLSLGDRFCATLQQEVADKHYKDAFMEVLDAEGIVYTVTDAIEKRLPPFELPE